LKLQYLLGGDAELPPFVVILIHGKFKITPENCILGAGDKVVHPYWIDMTAVYFAQQIFHGNPPELTFHYGKLSLFKRKNTERKIAALPPEMFEQICRRSAVSIFLGISIWR
jgi:hypothetical protein